MRIGLYSFISLCVLFCFDFDPQHIPYIARAGGRFFHT